MGLIMKGGRTPVRAVTASQRSQASMTWATLKTSVMMACEPSATSTSKASKPGTVAGILGVALGAMARVARPSARIALPSWSDSGSPCSETKPSRPAVRS